MRARLCHYQILTIYSDESTCITNRIKPYKLEQKAAEEQLRMNKEMEIKLRYHAKYRIYY